MKTSVFMQIRCNFPDILYLSEMQKNTFQFLKLILSAGTSNDDVRDNHAFFVEKMSTLKAIKSHFEKSYNKQNITLVVISYEIYQTRRRLV